MRIQHNIAALNSYRNLGANNTGVSKNLEKLSSGYRINRAGDDAAGLAISEKMRSQITGLNTATKNANDGISLVQTAEGALTEVHSMLNRMVEIATQSSNGVYEDTVDRAALQDEMNALTDEIDRIADGTNFNKKNLLDGSIAKTYSKAISTAVEETAAGLSLSISFEDGFLKEDEGIKITFIDSGEGDKSSDKDIATANANGEITIALSSDQDYTAAEIEAILKKTNTDAITNKDTLAKFKNTLMNMTVTGKGTVQANLNGTGFTNGVIAVGDYTGDDKSMTLQIGDTNDDYNKLKVAVRDIHASKLGLEDISVSTETEAGDAVETINTAINTISKQRGKLGAIQNRLEHTINNLSVNAENMTAAESRIRDVDMADEMMKYTKNNILVQASQAMLAQANQVPQGVLQLLQ